MRRRPSPKIAVAPAPSSTTESTPVVSFTQRSALDLLQRLGHAGVPRQLPGSESPQALSAGNNPTTAPCVEDRFNAALGCKTSEVALALLAQIVQLEAQDATTASEERIDTLLRTATAKVAELEPTTATEALLAVQMVGTQRLAMRFLHQATLEGQTVIGVDANVLRATRLMRLFNEQVETMAKLKGKGGQQRVVVEHVTVTHGGQAIVGTVIPGGRGPDGDDQR